MGELDWAVELAKELIQKYGQVITLRTLSRPAAPDPTKPHRPGPPGVTDHSVDAVFLDYEQRYIDGTVIQMGDQRIYMPSTATDGVTTVTPTVDGLVLRGAEKPWKIITARPLNPNGQQIMYDLQVRQ